MDPELSVLFSYEQRIPNARLPATDRADNDGDSFTLAVADPNPCRQAGEPHRNSVVAGRKGWRSEPSQCIMKERPRSLE